MSYQNISNDKNSLVSIVIPVYNGDLYLKDAIDSAIAQTWEQIEIIVVNDGSCDNTDKIALSYGDKIRYLKKENGGVSSALNMGIRNMKGKYFSWLSHDDMMHPDKIKIQMEEIMAGSDDVLVAWCGWNWYYQKTKKKAEYIMPPVYAQMSLLNKKFFPVLFGVINAGTPLISRKLFDVEGVFDETLTTAQDHDMLFRIFRNVNTVYIPKPLMDYRVHDRQGTNTDTAYHKNAIRFTMKMLSDIRQEEIYDMFDSEYKFYYMLLEHYYALGWEECFLYAYYNFCKSKEPKEGEQQREYFGLRLLGENRKRIVLYGAGKNGTRLSKELRCRNLQVYAFLDSNPNKTGKIEGIQCLDKSRVSYNEDLWIITFDNPNEMVEILKKEGVRHILTYHEITEDLAGVLPEKLSVLSQYNPYTYTRYSKRR